MTDNAALNAEIRFIASSRRLAMRERLREMNARARGVRFTCPRCGMVSSHPDDVKEGYCGNCHDFTGEERNAAPD